MDYRSLFHHFECGVMMYKNSQILEIEKDFQTTLQKCIKMQPSDYKRQKLAMRITGKILRMFAPLM